MRFTCVCYSFLRSTANQTLGRRRSDRLNIVVSGHNVAGEGEHKIQVAPVSCDVFSMFCCFFDARFPVLVGVHSTHEDVARLATESSTRAHFFATIDAFVHVNDAVAHKGSRRARSRCGLDYACVGDARTEFLPATRGGSTSFGPRDVP